MALLQTIFFFLYSTTYVWYKGCAKALLVLIGAPYKSLWHVGSNWYLEDFVSLFPLSDARIVYFLLILFSSSLRKAVHHDGSQN